MSKIPRRPVQMLFCLDGGEAKPVDVGDRGLVVGFSGGKDSTALVLKLAELGIEFSILNTPTGNELPEVKEHVDRVLDLTGAKLVDVKAPTLDELIREQSCLPNWRMRWCTRMIKIEPCQEWLRANPDHVLAIGLRSDEPGRAGLYDELVLVRYPLREWKWTEGDVLAYCAEKKLDPPARTDCAVCFFQTLREWWNLWKYHPELYAEGEAWEELTGHTFRSPGRDTRPAALAELRKHFEAGYVPRHESRRGGCRVCQAG